MAMFNSYVKLLEGTMCFFYRHAHIHRLRLVACPHEINRVDGKALLKDKNWTATNNPELVGGLEHDFYDFPFIGNVIIPID